MYVPDRFCFAQVPVYSALVDYTAQKIFLSLLEAALGQLRFPHFPRSLTTTIKCSK